MRNDLATFRAALLRYLPTVPKLMGRVVLEESADNFRRGGYENDAGNVVPWAPRQREDRVKGRRGKDGRRSKSRPNPRQRAILVKTGRLKRSVRVMATTRTSVTIGSDAEYAQAHQEGNNRGLKPRPFITAGKTVRDKITRTLARDIMKILTR
jgi:phage gpG-like protein